METETVRWLGGGGWVAGEAGSLLTALSRKFFCSGVRGRRRLADEVEFRASGFGSVLGGAEEEVMDAH